MKVLIVIAALTTLLVPTHGALRQCAGTLNNRYESSGFLTADWTKNACNDSGGILDSTKKGNQKCCNVPDANQVKFNDSCKGQKNEKFQNYPAIAQPC
ncbi:hypothetical protein PHMEG_00016111 [Phytophthora megakarya]|uniref:Secreted protein n=1 Tax=Phytophthora megakarya TaxID=4795 RepID=A0A225W1P6_9STRA|nr:hypothetical protein PHMEG_00016111 [Phytophthora megakarya]